MSWTAGLRKSSQKVLSICGNSRLEKKTTSRLRGRQDCTTKVANVRNLKHILICLDFFLLHAFRSVNQSFNYLQYFPLLFSAENSDYSYSEGSPIKMEI